MAAGGSTTEVSGFPTSVVGVATAVPAFIGYTEKAPGLMTPVSIGSMAEFASVFGGAWKAVYTMTSEDILDGFLRVQVTLQMTHPAEFIELTFVQTMES